MAVTTKQSGSGYGAIPGINTIPLPGLSIAGAGQLASAQDDILQRNYDSGLTIRVVPANGGHIISIRNDHEYSTKSDLHIIHEDSDLGMELGKIITLHYLKK